MNKELEKPENNKALIEKLKEYRIKTQTTIDGLIIVVSALILIHYGFYGIDKVQTLELEKNMCIPDFIHCLIRIQIMIGISVIMITLIGHCLSLKGYNLHIEEHEKSNENSKLNSKYNCFYKAADILNKIGFVGTFIGLVIFMFLVYMSYYVS